VSDSLLVASCYLAVKINCMKVVIGFFVFLTTLFFGSFFRIDRADGYSFIIKDSYEQVNKVLLQKILLETSLHVSLLLLTILIFLVGILVFVKKMKSPITWGLLLAFILLALNNSLVIYKELTGFKYLLEKVTYPNVSEFKFETENKLLGGYNDRQLGFQVNESIEVVTDYYKKNLFKETELMSPGSGNIDRNYSSEYDFAQLRLDHEATKTKYYRVDLLSKKGSNQTRVTIESSP
jgi:hypothetical protein